MVKEINAPEFGAEVAQGWTMIKFGATWCAACKAIEPAIVKVQEEFQGVKFVEMDADRNVDFVVGMGIRSLPTMAFYKDGVQQHIEKGMTEQSIKEYLKRVI